MKKRALTISLAFLLSILFSANVYAGSVAKIKRIDGTVSVLKKGAEKWRTARVNMPLSEGDAVYSREESFAEIVIESDQLETGMKRFEEVAGILKENFSEIEPDLEIQIEQKEDYEKVLTIQDQNALLDSVGQALNGVYKMSSEISDLVEASNNIAKVTVEGGTIRIECLTRSSVEDSKREVQKLLRKNFERNGFEVSFSGSYPGWSPNGNSPILKVLTRVYTELFSEEPKVVACHAGLECGIIGSHYPEMDMISFGPTIKGAHSPDERASITSVKRFWSFLVEILKNIPVKN